MGRRMPCGAEKSEVDGVFNGADDKESTEGHGSPDRTASTQCGVERGINAVVVLAALREAGGLALSSVGMQETTRRDAVTMTVPQVSCRRMRDG